jgi:hypothetical protein
MKFVKPKGMPQRAFDVWEKVYQANKKKVGEERAAKVAWSAVKKGWKKVNDKWVRKQASEINTPHKFMGTVADLQGLGLDPTNNNISEIEILRVGKWLHPIYGELVVTQGRLQRFKENFDKGVRKGIAIDDEHKSDEGAVGWVKDVRVKPDVLTALVEWTPEGIQLIRNRKYRFFSAEFDDIYEDAKTGEEFRDVLIGGAITNRPFMQNLQEIILSEKYAQINPKNKGGEKMKTKELKAKLLANPKFSPKKEDKVSKKVLTEVKEEIKKEAKTKKLSKKGKKRKAVLTDKTVTLSENRLKDLEDAANKGVRALRELRTMRLKDEVSGFVYSENNIDGVLLPKSNKLAESLMFTLGDKQRRIFTEFLKTLPKVKIFSELGSSEVKDALGEAPPGVDKYSWALAERAKKVLAKNPKKYKTLSEATYEAERQLKAEGIKETG